jgi:hypothetical protein
MLAHLVEEEDKELPSNEEVDKVKANEKLYELELNTLRIEKIREYIEEEKNVGYLETLLDRRVIKYPEIIKMFMIFAGYKKDEINFKGTNILNWPKAKSLLSKDKIHDTIVQYGPRGAKTDSKVPSYAKWQRILKCLEKYDQATVVTYNPYLAFILRFLQLSGKVRIADNEARRNQAKAER